MGGVLSVTDYETMLLPLTGFNSVHLSTHRKVKEKMQMTDEELLNMIFH